MSTTKQALAALRQIPLFADCSDEALARIASLATEFEADRGHVLVQPNQPGTGLFVLEEGTVVVEAPHGRRTELGPGEFFGDLALLDEGAVHAARVSAGTKVRCLAIGRADFDDLLAAEPSIAIAMLKVLARRLAGTIA